MEKDENKVPPLTRKQLRELRKVQIKEYNEFYLKSERSFRNREEQKESLRKYKSEPNLK